MLKVYTLEQPEAWDRVVTSIKNYDVFYLSGYVTAFRNEDAENGEPLLFYYQNGADAAIHVAFRRDISKAKGLAGAYEGQLFDLISPYGYGGFIGSVTDYDQLNREYTAYCLENGYVSEFVRFELFGNYSEHYAGDVLSPTHNVVRSLDMSLEDMWMDFKQKVRKNVKRAIANELQVLRDEKGEFLEDFLRIYYGTMDRNDAGSSFYFSREFFETLNTMEDHCAYFHVKKGDRIISTELVIYGAENCYSYLGGTDGEFFDQRPNELLKLEIIKWAKERGLKNFVLGGGYGADDGIFQYKTCLAPQGIVDFKVGRRIFNRDAYDALCRAKKVESHSADLSGAEFFPEYRK